MCQPETTIIQAPRVAIAIAAHKPYWVPDDLMYIPVQVGACGKPSIQGYVRDDCGKNISESNSRYCELTALYWAVNNLNADYIGLVHYRRHFKGLGCRETLTWSEAVSLLSHSPIVLPKKRNYYIETLESHYAHTFSQTHLDILRKVIVDFSPNYLCEFDRQLCRRSGHMFNMMIMRHDLLTEYCNWLFPILYATEKRLDFSKMTPFESRLMGRLSELLIDVWIEHNHLPYVECPVKEMEHTNWIKKGSSFLAAKFLGTRYKESF